MAHEPDLEAELNELLKNNLGWFPLREFVVHDDVCVLLVRETSPSAFGSSMEVTVTVPQYQHMYDGVHNYEPIVWPLQQRRATNVN